MSKMRILQSKTANSASKKKKTKIATMAEKKRRADSPATDTMQTISPAQKEDIRALALKGWKAGKIQALHPNVKTRSLANFINALTGHAPSDSEYSNLKEKIFWNLKKKTV